MTLDHMVFKVTYTALARAHQVDVDAGDERQATIVAPSARDAVDYAAAVMRAVLAADPLEVAWRAPSAPDGPVQG